MIGDWAAALESTGLARALAGSAWAYPLVNAGHIMGVALLVGGMIPLSLRLLGISRPAQDAALWRVLSATASAGLGLAVACGILLFITRAAGYVRSGLFISKMAVLAAGMADFLALRRAVRDEWALAARAPGGHAVGVRILAVLSLLLWPAVLVLGRLVGYF